MKIHRNGKVIYDSELTEDFPPELIDGDEVIIEDYEGFTTSSSVVYDVIDTGNAHKKGTVLSQVCPGQAFEIQD